MKKGSVIFILVFCLTAQLAWGQKGRVATAVSYLTQGQLDKAKETIDAAMKEESCADWAKAHLVKGQIYQAVFESTNANYKKLSANALDVSWKAYQEVVRLDKKKRFYKELRTQYKNLGIDMVNRGMELFTAGKAAEALVYFERALEMQETYPVPEKVDTVLIYNAAIAAQKAGAEETAVSYYRKALEWNYQSQRTYPMVAQLYFSLARTAQGKGEREQARKYREEGVAFLLKGHEKFPADRYILTELINFYLRAEEYARADQYLDVIMALDPCQFEHYRLRGMILEKTGHLLESELMYRKALEFNPDDFAAQFNLGNVMLNQVLKQHEQLRSLEDIRMYNAGIERIMSQYEKVVPVFERALELKSGDKPTMATLSQIYFMLRNVPNSNYYEKYEKIQSVLEN